MVKSINFKIVTYLVKLLQEPMHYFPLILELLDLFHLDPDEQAKVNSYIETHLTYIIYNILLKQKYI